MTLEELADLLEEANLVSPKEVPPIDAILDVIYRRLYPEPK